MGKTEIGIKVIKPKTPPPQPAVTPGSQQERAQRQHQSRAPRPAGSTAGSLWGLTSKLIH